MVGDPGQDGEIISFLGRPQDLKKHCLEYCITFGFNMALTVRES